MPEHFEAFQVIFDIGKQTYGTCHHEYLRRADVIPLTNALDELGVQYRIMKGYTIISSDRFYGAQEISKNDLLTQLQGTRA